jgi:hypothetical protein
MLLLMGICCAAGCSWSVDHMIDSSDPAVKIPAMKRAAEQGNQDSVEQLVQNLQSDDPAVRFYAIQSLQRLTGEDLGYHYYAPAENRREAVGRWNAWLQARQHPTTGPTTQETP